MTQQPTPGVGEFLGDAGALPEIVCGGARWRIGFPTQAARAALEELAVSQAIDEVYALERVTPPDRFKRLEDKLNKAVAARHYRTWGPGWVESIQGADGHALFVCSLLRERHPDATPDDARRLMAERPEELRLALVRVLPDFFALLVESLPGLPTDQRGPAARKMAEEVLARLTPTPATART